MRHRRLRLSPPPHRSRAAADLFTAIYRALPLKEDPVLQIDWERTLDTIPDAIAICDEQGRVVHGNRALRDICGLGREELLHRPLDEVLPPLSLQAYVRESLAISGVVVCDEPPPMKGRAYAATVSPIASEGDASAPSAAVVLLRDVTDERRMQRRLLLGERMAAVGQLAAGLAHEINNPVSFAYSNLQMAKGLLLQHERDLTPPLSEMGEMIDECMVGIARVRDIVRDLRTFTSTEVRSAAGEVRLDDIIDVGLRLTRSEVQNRARLVYDRDLLPTPPVRGDAGKLSHVLLNLLSQALHNLPPADDTSADSHVITVRTRLCPDRDFIELMVADTGPTLSDEMRIHLFEPFAQRRVRLPPSLSAAIGMGLAVSYEVVRRHGGEIEARPGPSGGNELIVRLPLHRPHHPPRTEEQPIRRVLFIDDDPLLLRTYRRLLADSHDVTTVSSARQALELLSTGESFDIIFCDLIMPVMDGAKLYRTVADRDTACAQRFVFLASGPINPEITDFLNQVDNPHVDKPVVRESLIRAMETLRLSSTEA